MLVQAFALGNRHTAANLISINIFNWNLTCPTTTGLLRLVEVDLR